MLRSLDGDLAQVSDIRSVQGRLAAKPSEARFVRHSCGNAFSATQITGYLPFLSRRRDVLSKTSRPSSVRSRAWLAGLAILVGITTVYADVAYVVTWPATHTGGGFDIRVISDDYFNGEVTTIQPVAWIVLGDVNRVTLEDLETGNVTDLSFVLTDRDNRTLLSVTHPQGRGHG
jgi:hypothetical protein